MWNRLKQRAGAGLERFIAVSNGKLRAQTSQISPSTSNKRHASEMGMEVVRPQITFPPGDDGDFLWRNYSKLQPEPSRPVESFVKSLLEAEVRVTVTKLELTGSLNPPPPPKEASSDIDIFRIDLKEYRDRLAEKDELHMGVHNWMHIVRLPIQVPNQDALGSDTLWVTGDNLAVFNVIRNLRKSALVGNPGIGKSWWQWQYLLYSLRPDVYSKLCADHNFQFDSSDPAPPSVIIRYVADSEKATVFFLHKEEMCVHSINNLRNPYALCEVLNLQGTHLLFEPGANRVCTVPYNELSKMSIIATVSPDEGRYKEFEKNGGMRVYLPCPSKEGLLAIASCMRGLLPDIYKKRFDADEIIARIDEIGPFPRYVLSYTDWGINTIKQDRLQAIDDLSRDNASLQRLAALDSIEIPIRQDAAPVSHWFLYYDVDRDHALPYARSSVQLVVSSKSTLELVRSMRNKVDILTKMHALSKLHMFDNWKNNVLQREWLEDVFAYHGGSDAGLSWREMFVTRDGICAPEQVVNINFQVLKENCPVNVNSMTDRTLYYRIESNFPFFDGVWKSGGRLFAFQATTSKKHPKSVETFESALQKLGIVRLEMITIYYVVMPRCFDEWRHAGEIPFSFFWKGVSASQTQARLQQYSERIQFALLCPPTHFGQRQD